MLWFVCLFKPQWQSQFSIIEAVKYLQSMQSSLLNYSTEISLSHPLDVDYGFMTNAHNVIYKRELLQIPIAVKFTHE